MTNKAIARILKETAALIELNGGNPYRARAFQHAARTIDRVDEPLDTLVADDRLTELRGIGSGLAAQIGALVREGSFELHDELLATLPPGLPDLLRIKGLGPKKVRRLWKELDVTSVEALEQAAQVGRIAGLDGFGEKSQEKILANVRLFQSYRERRRLADVVQLVEPVLDVLRQTDGIDRVECTGALRRACETIGTVELLVTGPAPEALPAALPFLEQDDPPAEEAPGRLSYSGALPDGLPVVVHHAPLDRFGTAWWHTTGSEAHVHAFVDRYGDPAPHADEERIYEAAGLSFVPPELREGRGELEAAAGGELPNLVTLDDLRGTLHNHTTYSDGAHSLRDMAEAARGSGYAYLGICDHSRSLQIANGLSVERVREQQEEIAALNDAFARDGGPPFRIFSGIESDILADGSLDYPDDVLASFDLVVASVHTQFNMAKGEATERILRAVSHPRTTILGHPTGRLLLTREGYPIDHERVIAACAEHGVAIELNANPYRLDLDWRWIRTATQEGVPISINPDAHATDQLGYMRWGVAAARKGWLTPEQCLNARPLDAFETWLADRHPERTA